MSLATLVTAPAQTVYVSGAAYLSGSLLAALPITGGSVTADARRSLTRDGSIELAPDSGLSHEGLYALLAQPGVEVALERGFVAPDGTRVGAPLGRFVVDELTLKRTPGGTTLSATLSDLSRRVSRARWADPYQVAAGTSVVDAINAILADRAPTLASRIIAENTPGTLSAPVTFEGGESSDPWTSAGEIARAFGYDLAVDATGAAVTIPEPMLDPAAAVFTFARGATAIRTDESRVTPLQRTYNGVIVSGEGPDLETPVRGEAWDANPASATYYLGPFGRVPMFYSSPLISTADQAVAAARTRLAGVLGRVEQLSWSQLVHPGLVPLDVVAVEVFVGLVPYILDAITIPLSVDGAASAVAREIVVSY